ncbi:MAG: phospholipid carrier-dependent glycosyltransferase [Thermoanaerobaculia bacterium]
MSDRGVRGLFVLLALTLLLMLLQTGRTPLFEPDEGRYAEIPREMLATGDFVTPRLNGVLYFEKPPLYYWLVAGSMALLGPSEWAVRLPGMLASAGMVLLTVAFARRRWGLRTALLAGIVTGTSVLVFILARIAIIDPVLSLALAASAFAFCAFLEAERRGDGRGARRALYGLAVAAAAAIMLKGLIGIVLPGGAIAIYLALSGRLNLVPKLFAPGPVAVFLLLAVPWHVAVARSNPDFLQFYFVHEHLDRFATNTHRRMGHPLYFVAVLLAGFLPWTGFFGRFRETFPTRLSALRDRESESFLWTFSILVFVFFSVSRSKLIPYLEPIWPALGLLLAIGIEKARHRGRAFGAERFLTALLLLALLGAGIFFGFGAGYLASWRTTRLGIAALAALLVALAFCLFPRLRGRLSGRQSGLSGLDPVPGMAGPWLAFFFGLLLILPSAARRITPWPLVSELLAELKSGDVLVQRGHYLQAAPFYTKRLTPVFALGWHELDFGRSHPGTETLFPSEESFRPLWAGPARVLAIVHEDKVTDFGDPRTGLPPGRELARTENGKYVLIANR